LSVPEGTRSTPHGPAARTIGAPLASGFGDVKGLVKHRA
jgi:hypothetical protein